MKKANEVLLAAIKETSEGQLNANHTRRCQDAARKMEDILFSAGGAERVVKTLQYFKDRAAVHEAGRVRDAMAADDTTGVSDNYLSKEEKLSAIVMGSLKDFVSMFTRQRGERDKGGGRRKMEDQNAYNTVMASLVSEELDAAKLTRMLSQKLGVSHRQIKRGRALRKSLHDMDTKHWIRRSSAVPRNAIGSGESIIVQAFCLSYI